MLHIVRSTRISREIKDVNEIRDYLDISAAACPEIPSHPHAGRRDYRFLKVETIDIVILHLYRETLLSFVSYEERFGSSPLL